MVARAVQGSKGGQSLIRARKQRERDPSLGLKNGFVQGSSCAKLCQDQTETHYSPLLQ
jgi:hypothetical protein